MSDYEKILYIINNEFYQLQDRMRQSGLDSALILIVCDGIKAKAMDELNAVLMSKLADAERSQSSEKENGGEVN